MAGGVWCKKLQTDNYRANDADVHKKSTNSTSVDAVVQFAAAPASGSFTEDPLLEVSSSPPSNSIIV